MWTNRCLLLNDSYEYRNCFRKDNADKANDDESSLVTLPITNKRSDKVIILHEKKYPDEGKYNHNDNDNNSSDECSSDDTNYPVRKMQLKSYYETIKSEINHAEDEAKAQQLYSSINSNTKKSHLKVSFDV